MTTIETLNAREKSWWCFCTCDWTNDRHYESIDARARVMVNDGPTKFENLDGSASKEI